MKRRRDLKDFARMGRRPLPFTDLDIREIRRGLDARSDRPSGHRFPELAIGKRPTF